MSALALAALLAVAGEAPDAATPPPEPAPSPDAPTVAARADRTEARIGDVVTLTVTAVARRGVPVNLPATIDLGQFSVLERKEAEQDLGDGKIRREFTLSVAAYDTGELSIPPVEVTYLGKAGEVQTAKTAPVPLKITSVIANEPDAQLKENAAPVSVWQQDLLLVYVAGALAVAALGGLLALLIARRLRRRAAQRPAPPPRPAHEVALEKLDRLGAQGFVESGDHRPFTFAVSEVIREYLGARFRFDSLELTTDELMGQLRRRVERPFALVEIEGWLMTSDLVKFAKVSPTAAEARGTLETAIRIVEATRPRPEPQMTVAAPLPGRQEAP